MDHRHRHRHARHGIRRRLPARRWTLVAALGALLATSSCADEAEVSEDAQEPAVESDDGSAAGGDDGTETEDETEPAEEAERDGEPEPEDEPEPEGEPEPEDEPEPQEAEPEGPPPTIAFGGDVMFEGMIEPQLEADPEGLLDPMVPVFDEADLVVVNLETAITEGGEPEPKGFTFRAPPTGLRALQAAGVDVASLANNHGLDYGQEGLEDTLTAAEEADFPLVGAGRDIDEAFAPHVVSIRGRDIAVIGATQVMDTVFFDTWPATEDRPGLAFAKHEHEVDLLDAVADAREAYDTVVVYLHWGVEGEACPTERQMGLAEGLDEHGADVVVGTHAHRLQGTGMLGDTLIDYGLGNFVFYSQHSPGIDTGVLMVTVEGDEVLDYEWVPARIQEGVPHPLEGDEVTAAVEDWDELRDCTDLSEE